MLCRLLISPAPLSRLLHQQRPKALFYVVFLPCLSARIGVSILFQCVHAQGLLLLLLDVFRWSIKSSGNYRVQLRGFANKQ